MMTQNAPSARKSTGSARPHHPERVISKARARSYHLGRSALSLQTWPPTVVGGDLAARGGISVGIGGASTWPPTVVGGDSAHPAGRPCRSRRFNVAADRRRRRLNGRKAKTRVVRVLQRGRRPSSAETVARPGAVPRPTRASTWPPTVVGGDALVRPTVDSRAPECFNVAADRRRRRPRRTAAGPRPRHRFNVAADRRRRRRRAREGLRGRRARFNVAADRRRRRRVYSVLPKPSHATLQRGRRPSSAETTVAPGSRTPPGGFNVAADRRRRRRAALRAGVALVQGFNVAADRRRRRPAHQDGADPHVRASTWPPTVVGGDDAGVTSHDAATPELQRGRRPSSAETPGLHQDRSRGAPAASTWPPTVVGGDADSQSDYAGVSNLALQRGRRPSSAETSWAPRTTHTPTTVLQRGRRPSSAET